MDHTRDEIERMALYLAAVEDAVSLEEAKDERGNWSVSRTISLRRLAAERLTQDAHWREAIRGAATSCRQEPRPWGLLGLGTAVAKQTPEG